MRSVSIEHATALAKFRQRQIDLLAFLNDPKNKALSEAFLKEPNMAQLFDKDPSDSQIKGWRYFYKACYNNPQNLWLICATCNSEKSSGDFLKSANKDYFGDDFQEHVKKKNGTGDIQEGLLFDTVYEPSALDGTIDIGGRSVKLPDKQPMVLGEFIRDWLTRFDGEVDLRRVFESAINDVFKASLADYRAQLGDEAAAERFQRRLEGDVEMAGVALKASVALHQDLSSSDEDTPKQKQGKQVRAKRGAEENIQKDHDIKVVEAFLEDNDFKYEINDWYDITPAQVAEVKASMAQKLEDDGKEKFLAWLEKTTQPIPAQLVTSKQETQLEKKRADAAEERADTSDKRADAEAKRADAAEERADETESQLEKERAEKAELKRKFEALEKAHESKVPSEEKIIAEQKKYKPTTQESDEQQLDATTSQSESVVEHDDSPSLR